MKSIIKKILLVFISLIITISILLSISSIQHKIIKYSLNFNKNIQIKNITGNIFTQLDIGYLNIKTKDLSITLTNNKVKLNLFYLIFDDIHINQFQSSKVLININKPNNSKIDQETKKTDINLYKFQSPIRKIYTIPFRISITNLSTNLVNINTKDVDIYLNNIKIKNTTLSNHIDISAKNITLGNSQVNILNSKTSLNKDIKTRNILRKTSVETKNISKYLIKQTSQNNILHYIQQFKAYINLQVQDFTNTGLTIHYSKKYLHLSKINLKNALWTSKLINISNLSINNKVINATYSGYLNLNSFKTYGNLDISIIFNKLHENFKISGCGNFKTNIESQITGSGFAIFNSNIKIYPNSQNFPIVFNTYIKKIKNIDPKNSTLLFLSKDFYIKINGNSSRYNISAQGKAIINGVNTLINLRSFGNFQHLTLSNLKINALNGKILLKGGISLENGINAFIHEEITNINLSKFKIPITINASSNISYIYGKINKYITISNINSSINYNKKILYINGSLIENLINHNVLINNLKAKFQNLLLNFHGQFSKESNAYIHLYLDNNKPLILANLKIQNIFTNVNIKGDYLHPSISFNGKIRSFSFRNFILKNMSLIGNINTLKPMFISFNLKANNILYNNISIHNISLNINSKDEETAISIYENSKTSKFFMQIDGLFKDNFWNGKINNFLLNTNVGNFTLNKDPDIEINFLKSKRSIFISPFKVLNQFTNINFNKVYIKKGSSNISILVPFLKTSIFNFILKNKNTTISGSINGFLNIKNLLTKPNIAYSINSINPIHIYHKSIIKPINFTINSINTYGSLYNNILNIQGNLTSKNGGTVNLNSTFKKEGSNINITKSNFNISNLNLNIANPFLPNSDKVYGVMNSNISISGNIKKPTIFGSLNINNIAINFMKIPIKIKNGIFKMNFIKDNLNLKCSLNTDQNSTINITGNTSNISTKFIKSYIQINSKNLNLNYPGYGNFSINENINLDYFKGVTSITGNIYIPIASINYKKTTNKINLISKSPYIKIITNKKTYFHPIKRYKTNINMNISLGKHVQLDEYGISTNLTGKLNIQKNSQKVNISGVIKLTGGTYSAYGQILNIKSGSLIFSNSEHPILNATATKDIHSSGSPDITVGIHAYGFLNHLEISLFSNPSMPKYQILSYLLTGGSLNNNTEVGDSSVNTALLSLALEQAGAFVTSTIKGVATVSIGAVTIDGNTGIGFSAKLSRNLIVGYELDLFDEYSQAIARYNLLPNLYFQGIYGNDNESSFGIFYNFFI
ncbi:MAG: translocation/assembly module TamB domain-containing protein [Psittacicella sp.]